MQEPSGSRQPRIILGCSRLLTWVGAAALLLADRLLHDIEHVPFANALVIGILGLGGLTWMALGYALGGIGKLHRGGGGPLRRRSRLENGTTESDIAIAT